MSNDKEICVVESVRGEKHVNTFNGSTITIQFNRFLLIVFFFRDFRPPNSITIKWIWFSIRFRFSMQSHHTWIVRLFVVWQQKKSRKHYSFMSVHEQTYCGYNLCHFMFYPFTELCPPYFDYYCVQFLVSCILLFAARARSHTKMHRNVHSSIQSIHLAKIDAENPLKSDFLPYANRCQFQYSLPRYRTFVALSIAFTHTHIRCNLNSTLSTPD